MKQWDVNWNLYRRKLVFAKTRERLQEGTQEMLANAKLLIMNGEKSYAVDLVENLLIDLQSCLTIWQLDKCVSADAKNQAIGRLEDFLKEWGAEDALERARKEVRSIANSQFALIAKGTDAGALFTYWGNDLCTGVDYSLRRGACYTTSNPSKINLFRQEEPEKYQEYIKEIMTEPGLSKEEVISRVSVKIVAQVARKLLPIYEATNGAFGVSFTQLSPFSWDNAQEMVREAKAWRKGFQLELGMEIPNVVFKMPATPASKEAAKELLKLDGVRVTMTSNFGLGQHVPFYEVLDGREKNCFLVIVDCHLRKFATREFETMGVDPVYYSERLVHAVVQRCYQSLLDHKSNIMINGAGMREDVGIRLCLTDKPELPTTLTVTPALVEKFDSVPRSIKPIWDVPISEEDMAVLNRSRTFRQAYYAEEFPWENARECEAFAFMMDGFENAYNACMDALPD